MTSSQRRADEEPTTTSDKRRSKRARPTPKWLAEQQDVDEAARRRCLMILSVLSGERAVTEVIMEAGISRQSYYDLETRALHAMLRALVPGAGSDTGPTAAEKRVLELEQRVKQLVTEKRRSERLLLLTRKVMKSGKRGTTSRKSSQSARASTTRGSRPSRASKKSSKARPMKPQNPLSTPTPGGESGPSAGTES